MDWGKYWQEEYDNYVIIYSRGPDEEERSADIIFRPKAPEYKIRGYMEKLDMLGYEREKSMGVTQRVMDYIEENMK